MPRAVDRKGREPGQLRRQWPALHERHDREQQQRSDLQEDQEPLEGCRQLRAEHADRGHHADDQEREDHVGGGRVTQPVEPEEVEGVEGGHLGERADHEDSGGRDRPAADPAERGTHRARDPREGRAAVRIGAVHVVEGRRDQEHRDERGEQHGRRLDAHEHHHDREDSRQRIGGRRRRYADDQAVDEADRVLLEPVLAALGGGRLCLHYVSSGSVRTAAIFSARRCCHTVSSINKSVTRKIIEAIT